MLEKCANGLEDIVDIKATKWLVLSVVSTVFSKIFHYLSEEKWMYNVNNLPP